MAKPRKKAPISEADVYVFKQTLVEAIIGGKPTQMSRHGLLLHKMYEAALKGSVLMGAACGQVGAATLQALKGKTVGVEQGSTQETYAKAYWAPKGVTVVPYQNQDQVYADLLSGRLDATL